LLLADVLKRGTPRVKKVASACIVCEAMNAEGVFKSMLSKVHKLIRLYITIPISYFCFIGKIVSALNYVIT